MTYFLSLTQVAAAAVGAGRKVPPLFSLVAITVEPRVKPVQESQT